MSNYYDPRTDTEREGCAAVPCNPFDLSCIGQCSAVGQTVAYLPHLGKFDQAEDGRWLLTTEQIGDLQASEFKIGHNSGYWSAIRWVQKDLTLMEKYHPQHAQFISGYISTLLNAAWPGPGFDPPE